MQDATFLFTDIEGSTRLWEEQPDRMRPALAAHDAMLREVVASRGGRIVKMRGDGVHAVFKDALDALAAALEIQLLAPALAPEIELRLRCGLHAGPSEGRDGDFHGAVVNRAARVMDAAHGGQCLLTEAVVERLDGRLPPAAELDALGAVRLRDLARPERIYQLRHPRIRSAFPPLRSLEGTPNNLPLQLSSFVGRERELASLGKSITTQRLVTIAGLGGLGKTRLALQGAAEALGAFPDGVWLVELSAVQQAAQLAESAAAILGVKEIAGERMEDTVCGALRSRTTLLVLDNCEHVLEPAAAFVRRVLASCPRVHVLTTSREPLRLVGESVFPIGGLTVPGPREAMSLDAVMQSPAVQLFMERALAAAPGFVLDEQNSAEAAAICHRLDGIPLALELAAARLRSMPLGQLGLRLKDRFKVLTSGDPTAMPRQRTLRATIDWSHELLPDNERALFRALSVFSGGWTIDALDAVCAGKTGAEEPIDVLGRLVEKSLVVLQERPERYHMLETVREYAAQQLELAREGAELRRRHLEHYVALAQEARAGLAGGAQRAWIERLDHERENLAAAHAAAAGEGLADLGLTLANGLKFYWIYSGRPRTGLQMALDALARGGGEAKLRAQGLFHAGQLAYFTGDYARARALLEESLALSEGLAEERGVRAVMQPLGLTALAQGDLAGAERYFTRAVALCRESGNEAAIAGALTAVGALRRAQRRLEEAAILYEEALALLARSEDHEARSRTTVSLAMVAIDLGELAPAAGWISQGLDLAAAAGSVAAAISALDVSAAYAAARGDWETCAAFAAAAERLGHDSGLRRDPVDVEFLGPRVEAARRALGERFDEASATHAGTELRALLSAAQAWTAGAATPRETLTSR